MDSSWWLYLYIGINYAGLGIFGIYWLYRSRFKIGFLAVFYRRSVGSETESYDAGAYSFVDVKLEEVESSDGKGGKSKSVFGRFKSKFRDVVTTDFASDVDGNNITVLMDSNVIGSASEYVYVGEVEFKKKQKHVAFGTGVFPIDFSLPSYRKNGWTIYSFDVESGSVLRYGGEVERLDPKLASRHLKTGVIDRFLLGGGIPDVLKWIIVGMMIALPVLAAVGGFFGGQGYWYGQGFSAGNSTGYALAKLVLLFVG